MKNDNKHAIAVLHAVLGRQPLTAMMAGAYMIPRALEVQMIKAHADLKASVTTCFEFAASWAVAGASLRKSVKRVRSEYKYHCGVIRLCNYLLRKLEEFMRDGRPEQLVHSNNSFSSDTGTSIRPT